MLRFFACAASDAEQYPPQAIEAGEMVDMRYIDEDMTDAQELPRRERRHVAEIEQQRAPPEAEIDEQARILEGAVHQSGLYRPAHTPPVVMPDNVRRGRIVRSGIQPAAGVNRCSAGPRR